MKRSPRMTKLEREMNETVQSEAISVLFSGDENDIYLANRLKKCQDGRKRRSIDQSQQWCCFNAGCWACRRNLVRKWWNGFLSAFELDRPSDDGADEENEYLTLVRITWKNFQPNADKRKKVNFITVAKRFNHGFRDLRDLETRWRDSRWRDVVCFGIIENGFAWVLIKHEGIARDRVREVLETKYEIVFMNSYRINPECFLTVPQTVALARKRRGIRPIRFTMFGQNKQEELAMPIL